MRVRLRPAYSEDQLKEIYATPHQHKQWKDHIQRVESTIALAKWFNANSVADLSCGDGVIIDSLDAAIKIKGDYAPGYEFTGPIEQTITQIPNVELFILSETLEHLDDPDAVLRQIRQKTKYLVLSTPNGETDTENPQHYWGWNNADVKEMLQEAGFKPVIYQSLEFFEDPYTYNYQIWGCK
jgi:hypothetical protein